MTKGKIKQKLTCYITDHLQAQEHLFIDENKKINFIIFICFPQLSLHEYS